MSEEIVIGSKAFNRVMSSAQNVKHNREPIERKPREVYPPLYLVVNDDCFCVNDKMGTLSIGTGGELEGKKALLQLQREHVNPNATLSEIGFIQPEEKT